MLLVMPNYQSQLMVLIEKCWCSFSCCTSQRQKTKCSPDGNWHPKMLYKFASSSQASPKGLSILQEAPGSAEDWAARRRWTWLSQGWAHWHCQEWSLPTGGTSLHMKKKGSCINTVRAIQTMKCLQWSLSNVHTPPNLLYIISILFFRTRTTIISSGN